jgi:hypothetical protein
VRIPALQRTFSARAPYQELLIRHIIPTEFLSGAAFDAPWIWGKTDVSASYKNRATLSGQSVFKINVEVLLL